MNDALDRDVNISHHDADLDCWEALVHSVALRSFPERLIPCQRALQSPP